jgi:hypothetical protein
LIAVTALGIQHLSSSSQSSTCKRTSSN